MKKFTKQLAIIIALVLTLTLFFTVFVACNDDTNPSEDPGTSQTPSGDGEGEGDGGQTPSGDGEGEGDGGQTPSGDGEGEGDGGQTPAFAFPEGVQKTWYTSEGVAIVVSANTLTFDGSAAVESGYYTSTNTAGTVTYYHFSVGMQNTPYAIYTDGTNWYLAEVNRGNVLVDFADTLSDEAPEAKITEIPNALVGTWKDGNGISIEITSSSVDESGTPLSIDNEEISVTQNDDGTYTITDSDGWFSLTNNSDGTLTYTYTDFDSNESSETLKKAETFDVTVKDLSDKAISGVTVTIGDVSETTGADGVATLFTIPGEIKLSGYDTEKYTYVTETAVAGDSSYYIFLNEDVTNTFCVQAGSTALSGITVKIMDGTTELVKGTTDADGKVTLTYPGVYTSSSKYSAVLENLGDDYYVAKTTTISKYQTYEDDFTINVYAYVTYTVNFVLDDGIEASAVSVEKLSVGLYEETYAGENLVVSGTTDAEGKVTFKTKASSYIVKVSNLDAKYYAEGIVGGSTNEVTITIVKLPTMTLGTAYNVSVELDEAAYEWSTVKVLFIAEEDGTYMISMSDVSGASVYKNSVNYSNNVLFNDDYSAVLTYFFSLTKDESIVFIATSEDYDSEETSAEYTLTVTKATPVTELSVGDNLVYGAQQYTRLSFTAENAGTYTFSSTSENFVMIYGEGDEDFANVWTPYEVELAEGQTITLDFGTYDWFSDGDYYVVNITCAAAE